MIVGERLAAQSHSFEAFSYIHPELVGKVGASRAVTATKRLYGLYLGIRLPRRKRDNHDVSISCHDTQDFLLFVPEGNRG